MFKKYVHVLTASLVTLILTSILQPLTLLQGLAQQRSIESCQVFAPTGKTVCGRFLEYWQQHGGLAQFGYPITNEFKEISDMNKREYIVQYFERSVFELHPENKPPYDVLLSQLGTYRFQTKYPEGEPEVSRVENIQIYPGAQNIRAERFDVAVPDQTVINITTFETKDSAQNVAAFYKSTLTTTGWLLVKDNSPTRVEFVHVSGADNPAYGLKIEMQTLAGKTSVKISLDKTLPK